jgi:hypothetical protein
VTLFESGAILLYLANKYGKLGVEQMATAGQWTLFANSTLCETLFNEQRRCAAGPRGRGAAGLQGPRGRCSQVEAADARPAACCAPPAGARRARPCWPPSTASSAASPTWQVRPRAAAAAAAARRSRGLAAQSSQALEPLANTGPRMHARRRRVHRVGHRCGRLPAVPAALLSRHGPHQVGGCGRGGGCGAVGLWGCGAVGLWGLAAAARGPQPAAASAGWPCCAAPARRGAARAEARAAVAPPCLAGTRRCGSTCSAWRSGPPAPSPTRRRCRVGGLRGWPAEGRLLRLGACNVARLRTRHPLPLTASRCHCCCCAACPQLRWRPGRAGWAASSTSWASSRGRSAAEQHVSGLPGVAWGQGLLGERAIVMKSV